VRLGRQCAKAHARGQKTRADRLARFDLIERERLCRLVDAEQGEDITITRHGLPVARLVSISVPTAVQRQQKQRVSDVMLRLRQLGAQSTLGCTVQQALGHGRD